MKYVLYEKVNMNYMNKIREQLGLARIEKPLKKKFCFAESEEEAKEIVTESVPYGFALCYETAEEFERDADDYTTLIEDALLA